ncbi:MAG: phospholipase D family protein [Deltaproteobacteria bacterium]|nr:phospholipase D family protein [Deltaproteobacteria bacterium]
MIRVQTPNFNDDRFREELVAALRRGVTVQLLHAKNYEDLAEGSPGQGGTNSSVVEDLFEDLANEPDALARLQLREYVHSGSEPVDGNAPHASHVKLLAFDDEVVLVTSMNMDTQSWNHSREIGVLVDSKEVTTAWLDRLFTPDFARSSPVRPER